MERPRGITILGTAVILYGAYNLLGLGNYSGFAGMFKPLPPLVVRALYGFSVLYGVCAVYCGTRILRLENWARRLMVGITTVSVILGFLLNGTVMRNFRELIASGKVELPPDMAGSAYLYAAVIMALVTLFELVVVFYFTRPKVVETFK